ncbi:MAG: ABC transporter permease [Anaerolineae bacterium]|nr:ABC transporter permease [Anaerolineae bacterium]
MAFPEDVLLSVVGYNGPQAAARSRINLVGQYILRRLISIIPTLFLIALMGFLIMELPPGDYVDAYVLRQVSQGNTGMAANEEDLREQFGLNEPVYVRFVTWLGDFIRGDYGYSFDQRRPVKEVIDERIGMTVLVSVCVFVISWGIGIPLGIYSATHQYSKTDNVLTAMAFVGLGLPDFLLALVFLVAAWGVTGQVLTGLFSPEFVTAPWSIPRLLDLLKHLWLPVLSVVITGMAWVMRVMRGNLLDELGQNYVMALRAKGVPERVVIWKHAVRNALHPLVASLGQVLAYLINGFTITSAVLGLPTIQAVYLNATLSQDIFLAGTILTMIGFLVLIGTLIADILLAWLDPRIRYN